MNESFSKFERPKIPVLGKAEDKRKESVATELEGNFSNNRPQLTEETKRKFAAVEYPKSDLEIAVIADINQILNERLAETGVDPFNIPPENIYLVPQKTYQELSDGEAKDLGDGLTDHGRQSIIIDAESVYSSLERSTILAHEMTHLKNFLSAETPDENRHAFRRIGLQMNSTYQRDESTGSFTAFSGLNEAVVSQMEKDIFKKLLERQPKLQQEFEHVFSSEEAQRKRAELAEKYGLAIEDIQFMQGESVRAVSYKEQRKVLNHILDALVEKLPKDFPDKDTAFKLFTKAHFGGQMLPMARAIRSVFGEDALRVISMMDAQNNNSARLVMNYLQKKGGRKVSSTEPNR